MTFKIPVFTVQSLTKLAIQTAKNYSKFISATLLLVATFTIFFQLIEVKAAVQVLGGIDLTAACKKKWNNNGVARLNGSNVWSWSCGDLPLDLDRACREQYANNNAKAVNPTGKTFDWYCTLNGNKIGGINLDANCRSMYGSTASTENKSPANGYNWRCGGVSIDTNEACRFQYGINAISRYLDQNNPYSWQCYQNTADNVPINFNLSVNDRVVYNPVKPPLYAWNVPCGKVVQGKIYVSIQGTVIEARNQVATCYGGTYTWNRVRFDNGVIGWVASQFLQKIVQPTVTRCNTPSQSFCVEYFNNNSLSGNPVIVKDDGGKPRWDWGSGSPASNIQSDNFSGQWTGSWYFENGTYKFTIAADDGIRVWIDNQLVVDKWYPQASVFTFDKALSAGNHTIQINYFESGGGATLKFDWQKITSSFNIEDKIAVNATFVDKADNTDGKSPNVDAFTRNVQLRMVAAPAARKSNLSSKWDNQSQVWFVIHGWDNDSTSITEANIDKVADKLARARPNDVVFVLDWGEASANSSKYSGGNFRAAMWIRPVAEAIQSKLTAWGLNSDQLVNANFIGHSLGSFMSSEIAYNLNSEVQGMSKVKTIIALDPASEINQGVNFLASCDSGYDLDGRSAACDRPRSFNDHATFSRAYVGAASFAGSYARAETAREAYLMFYGDVVDLGAEHGYVVETFLNMIKNSSDPINNIDRAVGIIQGSNFGYANGINQNYIQASWKYNSFKGTSGPEDFEGIIKASNATNSTREPDAFYVKNASGVTYSITK